MIKIHEKVMKQQREEEEEASEQEYRRRLAEGAARVKVKKPVPRTVVIGRKNRTKVEEAPQPIMQVANDTVNSHDRKIMNWMGGIPKPSTSRAPVERPRQLRKIDILAFEEEGVPLPPLEPQPFRLARPTDWAELTQEVSEKEEVVAAREDFGARADDATFISHREWEDRLAAAAKRRQQQQQPVETEQEEHSTGILGSIKVWASAAWRKVKMALWG